jgi:hypothetical protein
MSRRPIVAAAGLLLLVALTGCSASSGTPESTGTAAGETAAPQESVTPSAASTSTPVAGADTDYTCETILSPASLAVFEDQEADGFALQDDFVERSRNFGGNLVDFADFGGVLCQWSFPSGAGAVDYGYSPITEEQATTELDALIAGGYLTQSDKRGTLVVNEDAEAFPGTYLFTDGAWFYGSDKSVLNLVVDNMPTP